mmetsp:Transcript_18449/g.36915  ORF Transcript_18449/g.36915 Transcript_18449/m.36915 type:complete len:443 (+) Transcript_18449:142-1470(+)
MPKGGLKGKKRRKSLVVSPSAAGGQVFGDGELSLVKIIVGFVPDPETYASLRVVSRSLKNIVDPLFSKFSALSMFNDHSNDNPFLKKLNTYQKKTLGSVHQGLVNPHSLLRSLFHRECALCKGKYIGGINNGFGIPCHDDGKCSAGLKLRDREVNVYLIGRHEYRYLDGDHVEKSIGVSNSRQGYSGGSYGRGQYDYTTVLREAVPGFVPDVSRDGAPMTIKGYEQVYPDKVAAGKARLADEERRKQEKEEEAKARKRKREENEIKAAKKLKAEIDDSKAELNLSDADLRRFEDALSSGSYPNSIHLPPKAVPILAAAVRDSKGSLPLPSFSSPFPNYPAYAALAEQLTATGGFQIGGKRFYTTKGRRGAAKDAVVELYKQAASMKAREMDSARLRLQEEAQRRSRLCKGRKHCCNNYAVNCPFARCGSCCTDRTCPRHGRR